MTAALSLFSGCTELAPATDIGEGTLSGEIDKGVAFSCIGEGAEPPPTDTTQTVTYQVRFIDATTQRPPNGLTMSACNRIDVDCALPLAEAVIDTTGLATVELRTGFVDYFSIASDNGVPTLLFLDLPILEDRTDTLWTLIAPSALTSLAISSQTELDPERGHILLRTHDCMGGVAAELMVNNTKGGEVFSFVDGLPQLGLNLSDVSGLVGFINVPPGLLVVSAVFDDGEEMGNASLNVRPGFFTYGEIHPNR